MCRAPRPRVCLCGCRHGGHLLSDTDDDRHSVGGVVTRRSLRVRMRSRSRRDGSCGGGGGTARSSRGSDSGRRGSTGTEGDISTGGASPVHSLAGLSTTSAPPMSPGSAPGAGDAESRTSSRRGSGSSHGGVLVYPDAVTGGDGGGLDASGNNVTRHRRPRRRGVSVSFAPDTQDGTKHGGAGADGSTHDARDRSRGGWRLKSRRYSRSLSSSRSRSRSRSRDRDLEGVGGRRGKPGSSGARRGDGGDERRRHSRSPASHSPGLSPLGSLMSGSPRADGPHQDAGNHRSSGTSAALRASGRMPSLSLPPSAGRVDDDGRRALESPVPFPLTPRSQSQSRSPRLRASSVGTVGTVGTIGTLGTVGTLGSIDTTPGDHSSGEGHGSHRVRVRFADTPHMLSGGSPVSTRSMLSSFSRASQRGASPTPDGGGLALSAVSSTASTGGAGDGDAGMRQSTTSRHARVGGAGVGAGAGPSSAAGRPAVIRGGEDAAGVAVGAGGQRGATRSSLRGAREQYQQELLRRRQAAQQAAQARRSGAGHVAWDDGFMTEHGRVSAADDAATPLTSLVRARVCVSCGCCLSRVCVRRPVPGVWSVGAGGGRVGAACFG